MLTTRLTKKLSIQHPIIQAPMARAAGGKLASAVTHTGGMGMIGGGYCDAQWIDEQYSEAGNAEIGCGFISWKLQETPELLTRTLERKPKAIFLSFADPEPFAKEIKDSGTVLICQVQTLEHAKRSIDCGADIIVAQGTEAGGHGSIRASFPFVPEVADLIANTAPETLLCAAGGVADGRGLAASLMLGADGVVVGSRFWAATEALVHRNILAAAIASSGDKTVRTHVVDMIRQINWPDGYTCRVLETDFNNRWHNDLDGLRAELSPEIERWETALAKGDAENTSAIVGEATGLIHNIKPAGKIVDEMVSGAETLLKTAGKFIR